MSEETFTKTARKIIETKNLNLDGLELIAIVREIRDALANAYDDGYYDAGKVVIDEFRKQGLD